MIKKTLLVAVLMSFATVLFAKDYSVNSVKGKVQYQDGSEWKSVTKDTVLTDETVIKTGVNSTLVVTVDGKKSTVKALQEGQLSALTAKMASGIKRSGELSKTDVKAAGDTTKGTSTASSRASEAKADVEWDE